ncbi:MAG: nucleotidyl transferase AbiEii/AbiGii toxin family protein [Euzebyales bacterium]|nr:nucleotidyl transferase AbiEii/AbiGii toxin family protein [Euzebyales bacterium]
MRDVADGVLPPAAAHVWPKVVAALPAGAYLVGGTALAVRLAHRMSADLDVFVPARFDTGRVRRALERCGVLVVTQADADTTLNALLDGARVQFLAAIGQRNLDHPDLFDGMPVAGIRDLLATKLKVIGDRGELRDYVDVMTIEQRTAHTIELGLGYYAERYAVGAHHTSLTHIVRAMVTFDDVADDPTIGDRADVERFFRARHPAVVASLASFDLTHGRLPPPAPLREARPGAAATASRSRCAARTRAGTRCSFRARAGSRFCGKHDRRLPG